jgi:hypothetical protein
MANVTYLAAFRSNKPHEARVLAECVRVSKNVVFVGQDGQESAISGEMRLSIAEALDLLADQERRSPAIILAAVSPADRGAARSARYRSDL